MAEDLGVPNLTGLNVPIRTKLYDLVLAIYDEKIKDRKAFVSREVA
jgi:hypothetical protein